MSEDVAFVIGLIASVLIGFVIGSAVAWWLERE